MLRVFGAFLSIFCLLGMIVQLNGLAHLFGVAALALFALDLLLKSHAGGPRASRARIGSRL
jgi:hypothetical protein